MDKPHFTSPLSELGFKSSSVSLFDRERVGFFQVLARKGKAEETARRMCVKVKPGFVSNLDIGISIPTAPGEWIIICSDARADQELLRWQAHLKDVAYVSDQSHGRAAFRLAGQPAARLLAKECTIDLHPSQFPGGRFAQTQLAGIGVLIHKINDDPVFDLYCYSGFAGSFWHWLIDAGAEFGLQTFHED